MRIRLFFALSGLSGSNGHRRFGVVQTRTGDRSGAHRSAHGFWQGPAADLPDADRDNNRPQHIPPSTLRARLHMAVHEADTFARSTQPLVERRATNKNNDCCDVSCVVFMDTTHLHATCAAQPEELLAAQSAIKKRRGASGCLRGRKNTAPSIPPSPTNPRTRRRTVPPTLHPIF
ncbi:hypothetical protein TcBrA4_0136540 [Trypanosoma cruzi]|nr:hypothetical protein TcBrA4_0136540 [Trypanosoma cruzi]